MEENKTKRYLVMVYGIMDRPLSWEQIEVKAHEAPMAEDMNSLRPAFLRLALTDDAAYCDVYRDPRDLTDDGLFVCRIRL